MGGKWISRRQTASAALHQSEPSARVAAPVNSAAVCNPVQLCVAQALTAWLSGVLSSSVVCWRGMFMEPNACNKDDKHDIRQTKNREVEPC